MSFCTDKYTFTISSEKRNNYELNLGYKTIDFTFCQLLSFRKKVLDKSTPSAIIEILERENFI